MSRWEDISQPHYECLRHQPADVAEEWCRDRGDLWGAPVLKYLARHGLKEGNDPIADLRKAAAYLDRWIRHREALAAEAGEEVIR